MAEERKIIRRSCRLQTQIINFIEEEISEGEKKNKNYVVNVVKEVPLTGKFIVREDKGLMENKFPPKINYFREERKQNNFNNSNSDQSQPREFPFKNTLEFFKKLERGKEKQVQGEKKRNITDDNNSINQKNDSDSKEIESVHQLTEFNNGQTTQSMSSLPTTEQKENNKNKESSPEHKEGNNNTHKKINDRMYPFNKIMNFWNSRQ